MRNNNQDLATLAQGLGLLGHPVRLAIVMSLRDGEKNVGELVRMFKAHQPTVSMHLAALRRSNLVTAQRKGRAVYYSINVPRQAAMSTLLKQASGVRVGPMRIGIVA